MMKYDQLFIIMLIAKDKTTFLQRLSKIGRIQKKRFQVKGFKNIVIGVILLFLLFWAGWKVGQMVWPEKIQNTSSFVAWNSIIIHTAFQAVIAAISLPGYLNWFGAYKKYQVNKRSAWPWERQNWPEVRKKTILNLFVNQFLIYPIPSYLSTVIGIDLRFQGFPSFWEVFLQINLIFFMQDFFFYWAHRWAHEVKLFYKLHKVHHQFDHLFSPASEYHHPLDYILFNIMPSAFVFMILGSKVHCFTFFFWIIHKILFSGQNHCGYAVDWSPMRVIPLVAEVEFHDNHHSLNVGNYAGSWYIWDVLLGTAGPYLDEFLGEKAPKKA